jgi:hypothetical protein
MVRAAMLRLLRCKQGGGIPKMADYPEMWPKPVDGAEVLYAIEAVLRRHVSMPNGSPKLVVLSVGHRYFRSRLG